MEELATKINCLSSNAKALAKNNEADEYLNNSFQSLAFQLSYIYDDIYKNLKELEIKK